MLYISTQTFILEVAPDILLARMGRDQGQKGFQGKIKLLDSSSECNLEKSAGVLVLIDIGSLSR